MTDDELKAALTRLSQLQAKRGSERDAIALCDYILRSVTEAARPRTWATVLGAKANELQRVGRDNSDSKALQQAIDGYNASLRVRTRKAMPKQWAMTQMNRANALLSLGDVSNDAESYEAAVAGYDAALSVHTRQRMAGQWAMTQMNRAGALLGLAELLSDVNMFNAALAGYDAALEIRTRQAMPTEWAITQHNRANALLSLGDVSNDAEAFEAAIAGYDRALEVRTRETVPVEWAITQMNRANALLSLGQISGDATTYRAAVSGFDAALEVRTCAAMPFQWAATQMNRANALASLGEVSNDAAVFRDALAGYNAALQVRTHEATPAQWAITQMNRSNTLQRLGRISNDTEALDAALAGYNEVLKVHTRESMPLLWATTQVNRANALQRLGRMRNDLHALKAAVSAYDAALEIRTRLAMPVRWATTQLNRASAMQRLGEMSKDSNAYLAAVEGCDAALEVFAPETMPADWALTQMNRANALHRLGRLTLCDSPLVLAETSYREVSAKMSLGVSPRAHLKGLRGTLRVAADRADWQNVGSLGSSTLSRIGDIVGSLATRREIHVVLEDMTGIGDLTAAGLHRVGRPHDALAAVESGRAHLLRSQLLMDQAQLQPVQRAKLVAAQSRLVGARAVFDKAREVAAMSRDAQHAEANVHAAHTTFVEVLDEVGLNRSFAAPSIAEVSTAGAAAVVALSISEHGGLAFIIPADVTALDATHVLELPDLPTVAVSKLMGNVDGTGWYNGYNRFRADLVRTGGHGSLTGLTDWNATISLTLVVVWERLMGPLHERLRLLGVPAGGEVVLVPSGKLSPLPLHAAVATASDGSRSCFMDYWQVSYSPSLQAVVSSRKRAVEPARQGDRLLAITNPFGPNDEHCDLQVEDNPACRYFEHGKVVHLQRHDATIDQVRSLMPHASYLSFFCHGHWSPNDPDASHLQLAGSKLTVADLRQVRLNAARLVWLGACESGLPSVRDMPDEFQGLPTSLMQAGVPGVAATLWPVFNRHTEALMHGFYDRHRRQGQAPASAMHAAVSEMRGGSPSQHIKEAPLLRAAVSQSDQAFSTLSFRESASETQTSDQTASIFYDTTQPIHWAAFAYFGV
jgi:tetratricopeptide (TPR) repeat protein